MFQKVDPYPGTCSRKMTHLQGTCHENLSISRGKCDENSPIWAAHPCHRVVPPPRALNTTTKANPVGGGGVRGGIEASPPVENPLTFLK